jgi:hypothetical protein
MFPVYKGTFERGDGLRRTYPNRSSSYRDHERPRSLDQATT